MRRVRWGLIVVLCALALSGCSLISPSAAPQRIARSSVGFGLLNRTIPDTNHARVIFITQPVYIVDAANHLSPSSRIVPSPPVLATVIEQLLLGPTAIETAAGFTSALSPKLILLSASIEHSVGYVDFATGFGDPSLARQLLAEGQLVMTAYDVGATRGIVIEVGGVVQDEPLPNAHDARLLTQHDFATLVSG